MRHSVFRSVIHRLGACLVAATLAACSGFGDTPDPTVGWTPERLYKEAQEDIDGGNWASAIRNLEKLESRYPFGRWAQQAQIDIAYAYYKENDRPMALASIDRFLKLYPNHAILDYALYLKGLINFNDQTGIFARLGGQDLSERDSRAARESFDAFKELVARFPDSKYADDAQARMRYLVNSMAAGEVHVARFYFRRGAYVAAANRAQSVVKLYQDAPAIEEALYILMRSYDQLGLTGPRDDAERVLKRTFPDSEFLAKGIAEDDGRRWWQVWR